MKRNYTHIHTLIVAILIITSIGCATQDSVTTVWQTDRSVYIDTDTRPTETFTDSPVKSISVMRFDAKSVRTFGGKVIDYIELGNDFTDDVITGLYLAESVRVAVGEYEDSISETDYIQRKSGDLELRTAESSRTVTFKAVPYKKIDGILSGRVEKFDESVNFEKSFIEVSIKLVSSYDGEVLWITRMRGFYKDVVKTIVETLVRGTYAEPVAGGGQE